MTEFILVPFVLALAVWCYLAGYSRGVTAGLERAEHAMDRGMEDGRS